jgi:WD repeat-containing protein 48
VVAEGSTHSVYSMAIDAAGVLLACGAADGIIRLIDTRLGRQLGELRGHTDNVRALKMQDSGALLVSGSSDGTLRVWDVGHRRSLTTLAVHTDSVWAVEVDADFGVVHSGGRDGCVYRTQLASRVSELLLKEPAPVRRLAVTAAGDGVWVATSASSARRWSLDRQAGGGAGETTTPRAGATHHEGRAFVAGPLPAARARLSFEGGGGWAAGRGVGSGAGGVVANGRGGNGQRRNGCQVRVRCSLLSSCMHTILSANCPP